MPSRTPPARRLGIFGAEPAFALPLHVGRPNVPDKQAVLDRIAGALDRGWLTNGGPLVREFEQRISDELGVKHCIAVANGTIGLELAVRALELSGEVIVPAFTFIATAHALAWHGVTPVFCDVDPTTHTIDPRLAATLITPHTTAILGVHVWGRPCEIDALGDIAAEHGISLFFDAAHAFGSTYRGRPIGQFGACEVFSFHATKFVHCGEGGAITTNDDRLARQLRLLRNFGFDGYDHVASIGTNAKLSELSAALGLASLENKSTIVEANRGNYECYRRHLAPYPGLKVIEFDPRETANYQYVVVEVDPAAAGLTRDEIIAVLFAENVLARKYFSPGCHRMEPYRRASGDAGVSLPVAESLAARVFALPTGLQIDERGIATIAAILGDAIACAAAVRQRLGQRLAA